MTISCAWCKKEMGEKCPGCGKPASRMWPFHIFKCRSIDCYMLFFRPGGGGGSDTICEPCICRLMGDGPAVKESMPLGRESRMS
jgi:hypothetical protein